MIEHRFRMVSFRGYDQEEQVRQARYAYRQQYTGQDSVSDDITRTDDSPRDAEDEDEGT